MIICLVSVEMVINGISRVVMFMLYCGRLNGVKNRFCVSKFSVRLKVVGVVLNSRNSVELRMK